MKRNKNNEMDENCIRIESCVDWTQGSQSNVQKSIELNSSSALTKSNPGSISTTTKFDWKKLNPTMILCSIELQYNTMPFNLCTTINCLRSQNAKLQSY